MRNFRSAKPVDKRIFTCPQCGKHKMSRLPDHEVSFEKQSYTTFDDKTVELFTDICHSCIARNNRLYFQPPPEAVRSFLKAISEQPSEDDLSLEDLL